MNVKSCATYPRLLLFKSTQVFMFGLTILYVSKVSATTTYKLTYCERNHRKGWSVSLNSFASVGKNRRGNLLMVMNVEEMGLFQVTSLRGKRSNMAGSI